MKIYIIAALYYPHYFEKVKEEISVIFGGYSHHTVFVDNSGDIIPEHELAENVSWLRGSNLGGEFTAWEEGYHFIRNKNIKENDIFVFLNDTFCHHRIFTFYDRLIYRNIINNFKCDAIYGELNKGESSLGINQQSFNKWISSYIFMVAYKNIQHLLPLNAVINLSEDDMVAISNGLSKGVVSVPAFSQNLNEHLSQWLFPTDRKGWYKAKKISTDAYFFKLKAIINEKFLTYHAIKSGFEIKGIYDNYISRIYNSLRYRVYEYYRHKK
ncbi:hypothetical protein R0595_002468 [Pluralibacter gergoviae]|nr:hypothetical protein [Pluralibacter gergoviae]ELW9443381.1 hypothetical protein [Pluralibacter gergoviae]